MTVNDFYSIMEYIGDIIKDTPFQSHVYVVGGSVRDLIMDNDIKDIDLVIDLPNGGIGFAEWCKEQGYTDNVVTYSTYGTAMFHFGKFPSEEIECVMTRGEKYLDDGSRNPTVEFADLKEDALRRDLTINALYFNCSTGEILDMVGGKNDIMNHVIKTTNPDPDQIFIDDPLRILRVVRFSVRYGWDIEENTFKSMKKNVKRLSIITKERIQAEFNKILMSRNAVMGINYLHQIGAMKFIIPEFEKCYGLKQNAFHFGDVAEHTLAVLQYHCDHFEPNLAERIACLLHDIGKIETRTVKDGKIHFYNHEYAGAEMVVTILKNLKYDNSTTLMVSFLTRNHMRLKQGGNGGAFVKDKTLNKLLYECKRYDVFESLMKIIECDNMSHKKECCIYDQYEKLTLKSRQMPYSKMFGYRLPVTGDDIMEKLDLKPGPLIAEINNRLLRKAFTNPEITRDECMKSLPGIKKDAENYLKDVI